MKEMVMIDLLDINPYDDGHPPTDEGWKQVDKAKEGIEKCQKAYHDEGISIIAEGLKNQGEILPIAIRLTKFTYFEMELKYERLDGYKRYMAYEKLEMKKIPCYIFEGEEATPGMQYGMELWQVVPKEKNEVTAKKEKLFKLW